MSDDDKPDQALAAFTHAAEELRFFKAQQWRVANYTLLAETATVAVPHLLTAAPVWARIMAGVVALVAAGAGASVIASLDRAIDKERGRLSDARDKLPTLRALHEKRPRAEGGEVAGVLYVAVIVGALVAAALNVAPLG